MCRITGTGLAVVSRSPVPLPVIYRVRVAGCSCGSHKTTKGEAAQCRRQHTASDATCHVPDLPPGTHPGKRLFNEVHNRTGCKDRAPCLK